ncbi:MAG: phosphate ABC transporter permease PstA, partial [Chitinispirillaceae bacterium]|nr:phosphate ABC transporter permease PstA [Chitinispirillaceae bacterium]
MKLIKVRKKIAGEGFILLTKGCAYLIIGMVAFIFFTILRGGWDTLSLEFIFTSPKSGMTEGGIFPAIIGTFFLVFIMSVIGVPVGSVTAIFLSEYVKKSSIISKTIRFAVNTLAGIPSIVFGLFGLGFFIQFVGRNMDRAFSPPGELVWGQPSLLWAGLTMALLTLPVVIVVVEEAIAAVPQELREASLALGATKWETITRIVLPNSITGVLTGAILAVSRGAGEVAPILFTGVAYYLPYIPSKLSDQFMQLGYHVYVMATQSTNVEETLGIQYATTLVLLLLTFMLNLSAILL